MFYIMIRISLKFVPNGSIDNKWAFAQVLSLPPNRGQATISTYANLVRWRKYATLGGDELKKTINRMWLSHLQLIPYKS